MHRQPLAQPRAYLNLLAALAIVTLATAGCDHPPKVTAQPAPTTTPTGDDARTYTDAQWRQRLTADQYYILRQEGTEPPFRNALHDNKAAGVYRCAGDGSLLFKSSKKYDSGTGWPSFWQPATPASVTLHTDADGSRTEVECATCGGHLGHIFDDGPPPTGKRYCMNSGAMTFEKQ
jgi:peptide-methionine (R)-S-oxide reductase